MDQRHALVHHFLRKAAFFDGILVVLANCGQAAVERRLLHFFEQDGDTGIGACHRDAAAHGSRADDGGLADVVDGRVLRNIGDLGDGALGEKGVNQRARLIGSDALLEDLAFFLAALVEGQR